MESKRVLYTNNEKLFLKSLTLKYKNVIENKKFDASTVQEKNMMWKTIEEEFNSIKGHNKRTHKQLKKLWENLKTEKKKELAAVNRMVMGTDGKPVAKNSRESTDALLKAFALEVPSAVDSDSVAVPQVEEGQFPMRLNGVLVPMKTELDIIESDLSFESFEVLEDQNPHSLTIDDLESSNLSADIEAEEVFCRKKRELELEMALDEKMFMRRKRKIELEIIEIAAEEKVLLRKKREMELEMVEDEKVFTRKKRKLELEMAEDEKAFMRTKRKMELEIIENKLKNSC